MRVIDEDNTQLGVFPIAQALALAEERGLDLVEVSPSAQPPVCRLLDYGTFRYEQQRRERDARKASKRNEIKEVRLGVKIGGHDFDTKMRRAAEFLEHGDRVKVTVRFRGREITHPDLGRELLERATLALASHGSVERPALMEGKSLFLLLGPARKG